MPADSLEIRVLGELQVVAGGRPVALPPSKKARALLGHLVVTGTAHPRERLAELLWDGPDDPRAGVRWALAKLKAAIGDRFEADRERVRFVSDGVTVDLEAVRVAASPARASVEELQLAAERFRGELLEGLDLPDAFRYQLWLTAERDAARAARLAIANELVRRAEGRPELALRFARARLAVDPLSEAAHVDMMRLLERLGRPAEAEEQYRALQRILRTELGTAPSPETERVRMGLGRAIPASATRPLTEEAPVPAPDLIGRDAELATLQPLAGRAGIALVSGEPGIGKTRLLEAFAARMRAAGGVALYGRAFEAEAVRPWGAWIDALRLIPDACAALTDPEPTSGRGALLDRVTTAIAAHAGRAPLAILLDDVQWLDEAGAALLHFCARRLADAPVAIVLGARPGELAENLPMLRALRALRHERPPVEIRLGPLREEAIAALARSAGWRGDPARVVAEAGGHPLFAVQISRALAAGEEPSDSLEELLSERLAALDDGARAVLPWAAALGGPSPASLLAELAGLPEAELLAALDRLERRGVLRPHDSSGAGYEFTHDLLRSRAWRDLSAPRRLLVHARIARALSSSSGPSGPRAAEIAHHAFSGGEHRLAAEASLAAARQALAVFASEDAITLLRRGIAAAEKLPDRDRVPLAISLLTTRVFAGEYMRSAGREATRASLEGLVAEARELGLAEASAEGELLLTGLAFLDGRFAEVSRAGRRGAAAAKALDGRKAAAWMATNAACLLQVERDLDEALRFAALAESIAPGAPEVALAAGLAAKLRGELDAAAAAFDRARAGFRAVKDHFQFQDLMLEWVRLELERGRTDAAGALLDELMPVAERMDGGGSELACARAMRALVRYAAGDPGAGLADALAELERLDAKGARSWCLAIAAESDLTAGRTALAVERAGLARALAETMALPLRAAHARALLAEAALATGDRAAARAALEGLDRAVLASSPPIERRVLRAMER